MSEARPVVAIVDYGLGNTFSVAQACLKVGLQSELTNLPSALASADAVILPGVGAFGSAMTALRQLGLVDSLKDVARSGRPLVGICLGMQLLLTESEEFGVQEGLGLIEGRVIRLPAPSPSAPFKVPHVGWNRITAPAGASWTSGLLTGTRDGEHMYFVHSYYALPTRSDVVVATTRYGETTFCSAVESGNVFGCQFHPERSAASGLHLYANLAKRLSSGIRASEMVTG